MKSKDIRDPKLDDKRVLLVLPFQNLANSSKHDFIAESMFDFFVGGLSGYKNLKVLSKNTSLAVKQKGMNNNELIKRYNVRYVLSGSVTIFDKDMRTNIEIRDIKDCLLYTSPSPRDATLSRMPSSA